MKKLSLALLSVVALLALPGCGCKKKNQPLKPEATLGSEKKKNKKNRHDHNHESDENCKSCAKTRTKKTDKKQRHAFLELEEADILL